MHLCHLSLCLHHQPLNWTRCLTMLSGWPGRAAMTATARTKAMMTLTATAQARVLRTAPTHRVSLGLPLLTPDWASILAWSETLQSCRFLRCRCRRFPAPSRAQCRRLSLTSLERNRTLSKNHLCWRNRSSSKNHSSSSKNHNLTSTRWQRVKAHLLLRHFVHSLVPRVQPWLVRVHQPC